MDSISERIKLKHSVFAALVIGACADPAAAATLTQTFAGSVTFSQALSEDFTGKPVKGYYIYDSAIADSLPGDEKTAST